MVLCKYMSPPKLFLFSFVLAAMGCNRPPELPPGERVALPARRIQLPVGFLEQAFLDGKYYWGSMVRLTSGTPHFIWIDPEFVETYITDPEVKRLYAESEYLFPENREAYYQKIVSAMPREELRAHRLVWALPEVREQAEGGDGGMHTLVTWITDRPSAGYPYYYVEIKRNYFLRLGTCIPISYLKVDPQTGEIRVMNTDGDFLSLPEWRRMESGY